MPDDEIVALNNYLQGQKRLASLTWSFHRSGVEHEPQWTARCRIDGQTRGVGTGGRKGVARRQAAAAALQSLQQDAEAEE